MIADLRVGLTRTLDALDAARADLAKALTDLANWQHRARRAEDTVTALRRLAEGEERVTCPACNGVRRPCDVCNGYRWIQRRAAAR